MMLNGGGSVCAIILGWGKLFTQRYFPWMNSFLHTKIHISREI